MGVQCLFSFFKGIKTARYYIGKPTLHIVAIMVIKLAAGGLKDNNTLLIEQILRCLLCAFLRGHRRCRRFRFSSFFCGR